MSEPTPDLDISLVEPYERWNQYRILRTVERNDPPLVIDQRKPWSLTIRYVDKPYYGWVMKHDWTEVRLYHLKCDGYFTHLINDQKAAPTEDGSYTKRTSNFEHHKVLGPTGTHHYCTWDSPEIDQLVDQEHKLKITHVWHGKEPFYARSLEVEVSYIPMKPTVSKEDAYAKSLP